MANNTKYITLENLKKYDELLKTYIAAHASSGSSSAFRVEKVDALPNASDAEANVLYVVTNGTNEEGQRFDEYMLVDGAMEKVGSSSIDLADYYTKAEVAEAIAAYAPFEVVADLPSPDVANPKKIYIVTDGNESLQRGSYVYTGTGEFNGYVSVGTTVKAASNTEVQNDTQNNGGNDPDPNDPNQGGNGGNEGGNTDPDPNQGGGNGGNEGGNTDPTPVTKTSNDIIFTESDNTSLRNFEYIIDNTILSSLGLSNDEFITAAADHSLGLYYKGTRASAVPVTLADNDMVRIPYQNESVISGTQMQGLTNDVYTWNMEAESINWKTELDDGDLYFSITGFNGVDEPIFVFKYTSN